MTVQDATGRIEVNGVNKGLTLRNVNGDIAAETVNGSIVLDGDRVVGCRSGDGERPSDV